MTGGRKKWHNRVEAQAFVSFNFNSFFLLLVDDTVEVVSISCWLMALKGMLHHLSCPKKGGLTPSLKALSSLSVLRTVGR